MTIGEERKYLKENYATTSNKELSQRLSISIPLVQKHARFLGLRKDPNYLSAVNRKNGLKSSFAKDWKYSRKSDDYQRVAVIS